MTSKAKSKGNAWEREITRYLGEQLGGHWMRVPSSGAFIGGSNSSRKILMDDGQVRIMKGDIIPPSHLTKLNIEAKSYKDINFHQIINGNCAQLDSWIDQTETPADPGDFSMTIFKITRKGSWIVFRQDLAHHFTIRSHVVYWKNNDTPYVVTDYESFVEANREKILELGQNGTI